MASIADEKYISLTTFKKDGTAKPLPVWIADFGDGTVGFTTASSSFKVKRIRNNSKVLLQPSDAKGNVKDGTVEISGTAEVKTGADFTRCEAIVKKKYGMQYRGIKLVGKIAKLIGKGSGTDAAVIITLDQ